MSDDCTCATCGKSVDYDDAFTHAEHEGQMYTFCCRSCYEKSDVKSGK